MRIARSSGILLHPTCLPGPYGIGDLGSSAYDFIDFLALAKCEYWQILPLGPIAYGNSPYQSLSAFAGNPYLVNPDFLAEEGLVNAEEISALHDFAMVSMERINFREMAIFKKRIIDLAYSRFSLRKTHRLIDEVKEFEIAEAEWLNDYKLYTAIKEQQGLSAWVEWPEKLRKRDPDELKEFAKKYSDEISKCVFRQFLFFKQWKQVKNYANRKGIKIIGDIPIFLSHDSSDVWANPQLFFLQPNGQPEFVAGVPPDYFSESGQLWGNPIYNWAKHEKDGFSWWISRIKAILSVVDLVRIDHFRGFMQHWQIPFGEKTAINGSWEDGPGYSLFHQLAKSMSDFPIIAEDLGVITDDVIELREKLDIPGMKVLVFAFDGDSKNPFLPHNFTRNCAVYTGTHDNDTVLGWYQRVDEQERENAKKYLHIDGEDISWDLIRSAWSSVADLAMAPMQDFLSLDNQARMNFPGTMSGNWEWRLHPESLTASLSDKIRKLNIMYGRAPS